MRMMARCLAATAFVVVACSLGCGRLAGDSPKLTVVECGFPGLCGYRLHTVAEKQPGRVVVHRVKADGTVQQLGQHRTPDRATVRVIGGVGEYYGVSVSSNYWGALGSDDAIRVYEAGRELYAVPRNLMSSGARVIRPRAVLANGNLFVAYDLPGGPMEPFTGPNPPLLRIIAHGSEGVRSYDLVATPAEARRIAFAGDGSVAAVSLGGPPSPAGIECRTVVYSATDGKVLRTIEKFAVSWISHDGRLVVGDKTNAVTVYQDGDCIAERATKGIALVEPCADGRYATLRTEGPAYEILDLRSLKQVTRVSVSAGFNDIADRSLAPNGRLAVYEYTRTPSRKIKSRLVIYQLDGKVLHTDEFGTTEGWAVRSPAWFAGGKVLLYLNEAMTRIVRLEP